MAVVQLVLFFAVVVGIQANDEHSVQDGLLKRILIEDNYYTIISRLDALESENGKLKQEITSLKQSQATMAKQISLPAITFMAYMTHSVINGTNQPVIFQNVKLNQGYAYNPYHGNFLAPLNGTYMFQINACALDPHYVTLDLIVNSSKIGRVISGDKYFATCSSNTFYVHLKTGDDVYVQHGAAGDYLYESRFGDPSFSGTLLHADT